MVQANSSWEGLINTQALDALHSLVQHLHDLQVKESAEDQLLSQLLQIHEEAMADAVARPSSKVRGLTRPCRVLVEMERLSVQGADSKIKALENSLRALVSASTLPQARGLMDRTLQSLSKAENGGQALLYIEVGC